MNNKIILSIHHKYSELILTEKKTLEIRKSAPRRGAWGGGAKDTVFLYETKADGGAGAVVGFFSSAIYGWRVNMVVRFPKPRPLSDFGLTRAPQSWQYLK